MRVKIRIEKELGKKIIYLHLPIPGIRNTESIGKKKKTYIYIHKRRE